MHPIFQNPSDGGPVLLRDCLPQHDLEKQKKCAKELGRATVA